MQAHSVQSIVYKHRIKVDRLSERCLSYRPSHVYSLSIHTKYITTTFQFISDVGIWFRCDHALAWRTFIGRCGPYDI